MNNGYIKLFFSLEPSFIDRLDYFLEYAEIIARWREVVACHDDEWKVKTMQELLPKLAKRQKEVIEHYFGLNGKVALHNYTRVGDNLKLASCSASQYAKRAKEKLVAELIFLLHETNTTKRLAAEVLLPELRLSTRAFDCLNAARVKNLQDLIRKYPKLHNVHGCGKKVLAEVTDYFEKRNLLP